MSNTPLPLFWWEKALKIAMYILNKVLSNVVQRTPFDLWTNRKPSLNHVHICGCPVEAKIFNPYEKKLDLKTLSYYYISYLGRSKGYRFYCPSYITWIVETGNAKFLKNSSGSGSTTSRRVAFEEQRVDLPLPNIVNEIEFLHNHLPHDVMKSPLNQPLNEETVIIKNTH